ncbi:hypothetical protein [Nocardioides sp. NPDC004968]|uniref:SMODS domain-containing nucleotidyltransferase n=1 Tax=Nocardioides sp. NPDC004968 TaxID=3155894 RepID=UPI0033A54ABD
MTTTRQAFDQFLENITATDYQKTSIIDARKNTVVANLQTAFPESSDLPFHQAHLMGSAAKKTITRPIDDVDVLAVFSDEKGAWLSKYRYDSQAFIYRIRQAYDGLAVAQVGTRGQAVRVMFRTGGHVDVAPVFIQSGDVYYLPNGSGGWLTTAPTVANAWFNERNADRGGHLAPLVRLLKKWNRAHSKRFRSYHLETVAANTFSSLGSNHRENLKRFFVWGQGHLDVHDPGRQSGSLADYLTWTARTDLKSSMQSAADRAEKAIAAEAAGNHADAKRLWKIILGSDFPA